MTDETITVYVTKYALTTGIQKMKVERSTNSPGMVNTIGSFSSFRQHFHGLGKEWHLAPADAIARAEEMRQGKIKAIKKSLARLEKLSFVGYNGS